MNKVLTISLNNTAYQLEESGYEALQAYLLKAAEKLHDNPDKDEIMADFEEAIGDKCAKYIKGTKNVITAKEIEEVLKLMGPVEDIKDDADKKQAAHEPVADAPKRLFKIREGAVIEGVCNGIAVYANVDATLVRVGFIILTVFTGGAWIVAYVLMAIFMPEARTAEDMATARGEAINAKTLLDGAKERYEYWKKFGEQHSKDWMSHKAEYKQEWKKWRYEQKKNWKQSTHPAQSKASNLQTEQFELYGGGSRKVSRAFAGLIAAIGIILIIVVAIAWAVGIFGVIASGTIFGYFGGASKLLLAVLLMALFLVVLMPLQGVVGSAMRFSGGKPVYPHFWGLVAQYMVWLGAIASAVTLALNIPEVRDMVLAHWFGL